jgi:hypothetical protein
MILRTSLLLLLACGGSGPRAAGDAGPMVDAFALDSTLDVPPDTPLLDAGPEAALVGTLRYEIRDVTERGLSSPSLTPLANIGVALMDGGRELERSVTNAAGIFVFLTTPPTGATVRVIAEDFDPPLLVSDQSGAIYTFERSVSGARLDFDLTEPNFSGALALYETIRAGLVYADDVGLISRQAVEVRWERGRNTPGGTSYALGPELWILGGPSDTDEFDTPVVMHELGHFVQSQNELSSRVGPGDGHEGVNAYPDGAWREGWASFFSSAARGSAFYGDTIGGETAFSFDLNDLPRGGEYLANVSGSLGQTHSEWVVAGALYEMLEVLGDAALFAPLLDYIVPLPNDRGSGGRDLVDFLDGMMCSPPDPRATIQSVVVDTFRFPYDFNSPCLKPGRRQWRLRPPAPVVLPGRVVEVQGRRLRIITVSDAVSEAQMTPLR